MPTNHGHYKEAGFSWRPVLHSHSGGSAVHEHRGNGRMLPPKRGYARDGAWFAQLGQARIFFVARDGLNG